MGKVLGGIYMENKVTIIGIAGGTGSRKNNSGRKCKRKIWR